MQLSEVFRMSEDVQMAAELIGRCSLVFLSSQLVKGQALSPKYLHKVDFAYLLVYNQSLTTASESRLFGSVVRALVLYRGDPGSNPSEGTGNFSAMLYIVTAIMS